jgi:hypothetical protein
MWHEHKERALHEGLITAIAVGGFFILLGVVLLSPGFFDNASAFFDDFTTRTYPVYSGSLVLPYPAHPADHTAFFTSLLEFAAGIALLQIIILPMRLAFKSPLRRISETVGNLVYWVGAVIVGYVYLLAGTVDAYFTFWAYLIVLVGVGLIARGLVYFAHSFIRKPDEHR